MLGMGIVTTFFLYVFINMAMVMGLVPIVGVPLPLISYGGSAMLTLLFGFGLVLNIYIHRDVQIGRHDDIAGAVATRFAGLSDAIYASTAPDLGSDMPPGLIADIPRADQCDLIACHDETPDLLVPVVTPNVGVVQAGWGLGARGVWAI